MHIEILALSINDTAKALSLGRSSVYSLAKAGKLDTFKAGTRTLITTESIARLIETKSAG